MSFSLRIRDHIATWDRPAVMGILNVTPDSFYAPSRKTDDEAVAERVRQIIDEGADFIDIGAYSTRPGAAEVSADEEIDRLGRAMAVLRREAPDAIVSVDTFRASVARVAVTEMGCDIVNDVAGTNLDPDMVSTVADLGVPYILSHMRGTPADMMEYCQYEDVVADVMAELGERLQWLAMEEWPTSSLTPVSVFRKLPSRTTPCFATWMFSKCCIALFWWAYRANLC